MSGSAEECALFHHRQQADAFWEYVWAIFPKAIFWPAYMVYEGFKALRVLSGHDAEPPEGCAPTRARDT